MKTRRGECPDPARDPIAFLNWMDCPLGQVPRKRIRSDSPSFLHGQVVLCSACRCVVGVWVHPTGPDDNVLFLNPIAGWVLDRVERGPEPLFMCGRDGLLSTENTMHPVACSDRCELRILNSKRWEPCEPPPGYKQFTDGLEPR